jgi:cytochrome c peroxidase
VGADATPVRHLLPQHRNFGEFRVPSLRGVEQTAPYMHDGQLPTLMAVIDHYDRLNEERLHADGERLLQPLGLNASQRSDLQAFLQSLSAPAGRGWRAVPLMPCQDDGAAR